jgi:hypothetical protein
MNAMLNFLKADIEFSAFRPNGDAHLILLTPHDEVGG